MKIIGIIPARGGSKGIRRKNIKKLAGKPLIVYSIEIARQSTIIDDVVVSTDCSEIARISKREGAEVIDRPAELAGDHSLVMDTVRHALAEKKKKGLEYDLMVLLEPTSPFRTTADIRNTIELLLAKEADSAATFSETDVPPSRIWKIEEEIPAPFIENADPFQPRQQHEKGYALNGMVYVLKTSMLDKHPQANSFLLGKSVAHIIPKERVVDIDTEKEFYLAEQLIKKNHIKFE